MAARLFDRIPIAIGAMIAILLQAILAPIIAIGPAVPNFVLAYVIAVAVGNARSVGYVMPFLAGLAFDLMGAECVGSMAFICVLTTFLCSFFFRLLDNETIFIPILVIVCGCLFASIGYGLLMIACGQDVSLLEMLLYKELPCFAYDTVLSCLLFPLVLRFVLRGKQPNEMTIIDSRVN